MTAVSRWSASAKSIWVRMPKPLISRGQMKIHLHENQHEPCYGTTGEDEGLCRYKERTADQSHCFYHSQSRQYDRSQAKHAQKQKRLGPADFPNNHKVAYRHENGDKDQGLRDGMVFYGRMSDTFWPFFDNARIRLFLKQHHGFCDEDSVNDGAA